MIEAIATATEVKNNFGKYLNIVLSGNEVIITRNGKEIGRIIPKDKTTSFLSESLKGILKKEYDIKNMRDERISAKYETID